MLPFVGVPLYSAFGAHYLQAQQVHTNQANRDMILMKGHFISSLLPDAFNGLMCEAMNAECNGHKATHFVLVHGDIVPQDAWLTTLLDDMTVLQLDVLSAVVPIKAVGSEDTSTAVGVLDGRKSSYRRLTTTEAAKLPRTFLPGDVCQPGEILLLNTGLMAIDLRKPWVEEWMDTGGFRLESHGWKENGKRKQICLPEDWLMSWDVQTKFEAKVGATTKVRVLHYGEVAFENRHPDSPVKQQAA